MRNKWEHEMDGRNVCRFPSNEFWNNIGCLVSGPNSGLGGSRMLDK